MQLQPVRRGQPIPRDADTWSAMIEAARAHRNARGGDSGAGAVSMPIHTSLTCLVKYDEEDTETLPVHSVVTLASLIPTLSGADGDPHGTNRRPAYVTGTPTGAGDAVVVTLEPIQGGSLGRAVHTGHVVVTVDVSDEAHTHAVPIGGDTDKFASADGGYPIVHKESGTGPVKAVVILGQQTGGPSYTTVQPSFNDNNDGIVIGAPAWPANTWQTFGLMYLPRTPGVYMLWWQAALTVLVGAAVDIRHHVRLQKVEQMGGPGGPFVNTDITGSRVPLRRSSATAVGYGLLNAVCEVGAKTSGMWLGEHLGGDVYETHYRLMRWYEHSGGSSGKHDVEPAGMAAWQLTGLSAGTGGGLTGTFP